jgi:DNA-binding NarL/FixJ family response regulator
VTVTDATLRVVIAEDSVLIREGIARLIEESGGTVVGKVGDGPPGLLRRDDPAAVPGRGTGPW